MTTAAPSPLRPLLAGLGVALALAVGGGLAVQRATSAQLAEETRTRRSVASLAALADLVARAASAGDADGEQVRRVVAAWQAGAPAGTELRVIRTGGAQLVASTVPADAGDKAAPRRLSRDEKPLYDQAQRLRAARESNREGGAPKPEVEVEVTAAGGRVLAAPLSSGEAGDVVGLVQATEPAGAPGPGAPFPAAALLALLVPFGLLWGAGRVVGTRRWPLSGAAVAALALGLALFAVPFVGGLTQAVRAGHQAVSDHVRGLGTRAAAVVAQAGLPAEPALRPGAWDADLQLAPRGLLAPDGALDEAGVAASTGAVRRQATGSLVAGGLVGLLALAFIGLGGAAAVWRAVVTHRQAYAYVAPAMAGTLILVFFPFLYGIALSFTDSNIYNTGAPLSDLWIGLKNYGAILTDFSVARRGADGALVWNYLNFYWTFLFTVFWTVTNVAWGVSFGLLLALVLNTKALALRPVYRMILILPWAMPNYITALIWKGMFHRQFGVVNQLLPILGVEPISWFDHVFSSYFTALATNGWLSFPFMMVVSLGALQSIPADVYEAARVDGASRWQQFTAITLPSLKPALVPAVILSVVWTFNMFNIIYLVTAGAPNSATEILITQAYKFAFERYRYGYAAAYATIIFGILLVYGNVQNRVTKATEGV